MGRHAGRWQAIAIPKWMKRSPNPHGRPCYAALQKIRELQAKGGESTPQNLKSPPALYLAGSPLTADEIKEARSHRPRPLEDGAYLCWDFSTHAGCHNPAATRARGKRDVIKTRGLHPLIKMHLVRGFHRSEKRINPADVDGYFQGLRNALKEETQQHPKVHIKSKATYKPKASGSNGGPVGTVTGHKLQRNIPMEGGSSGRIINRILTCPTRKTTSLVSRRNRMTH